MASSSEDVTEDLLDTDVMVLQNWGAVMSCPWCAHPSGDEVSPAGPQCGLRGSQPGSSDTPAAGSPILHPEGWGRGRSSRTKHRNLMDKPKYRIVNLQVEFSTHVGVSTFPS